MSCSMNSRPLRPRSSAALVGELVDRSSTQNTRAPSASNRSHRWKPKKPAPPVTRTRLTARMGGGYPEHVRANAFLR